MLVHEPKVFSDSRGHFFESDNRRTFRDVTGLDVEFVQDNESVSSRNVLRGSPTLGKWTGATLSPGMRPMIWIPTGFAHGLLVLSEQAIVSCKTTETKPLLTLRAALQAWLQCRGNEKVRLGRCV